MSHLSNTEGGPAAAMEAAPAPSELETLREVPVVFDAPYRQFVERALADGIPSGIYKDTYLADVMGDRLPPDQRFPRPDLKKVTGTIRAMGAWPHHFKDQYFVRLNTNRIFVLPTEPEAYAEAASAVRGAEALVNHLQDGDNWTDIPGGSMTFEECVEIGRQHGLLPERDSDGEYDAIRIFDTHPRVDRLEDGTGIRAIKPKVNPPETIGQAMDILHARHHVTKLFDEEQLIDFAFSDGVLPLNLRDRVLQAFRIDPRMGYLGFNGKHELFIPHGDHMIDNHGLHDAQRAAHATGDILAMRGLADPTHLRQAEAERLAMREGLIGEMSTVQRQTFLQALYLHPAIQDRNPGATPHPHRLSDAAKSYREQVLFGHISRRRQTMWQKVGQAAFKDMAPDERAALSREDILTELSNARPVEVTEYDFLEKCVIPRIRGWREAGLPEHASRRKRTAGKE